MSALIAETVEDRHEFIQAASALIATLAYRGGQTSHHMSMSDGGASAADRVLRRRQLMQHVSPFARASAQALADAAKLHLDAVEPIKHGARLWVGVSHHVLPIARASDPVRPNGPRMRGPFGGECRRGWVNERRRIQLERDAELHLERSRRHEVRAAERGQEVVERLLIGQVDDADPQLGSDLLAAEEVVDT